MEDIKQTAAYRNGGKVFRELYSHDRLTALKRIVENIQLSGKNKKYSISVDGEVVISTTTNTSLFDNYLDFLSPHTKVVEVRLFFGDSPNSNRHIFYLREETLDGFKERERSSADVDTRIEEALERQRLQTEVEYLRKKKKSLKRKLKEYEEVLAQQPAPGVDMNNIVDKGVQLLGLFKKADPAPIPVQGVGETTVTVEAERTPSERTFDHIKANYPESEVMSAIRTWQLLCAHPELQPEIIAFINSKIKNNGNA